MEISASDPKPLSPVQDFQNGVGTRPQDTTPSGSKSSASGDSAIFSVEALLQNMTIVQGTLGQSQFPWANEAEPAKWMGTLVGQMAQQVIANVQAVTGSDRPPSSVNLANGSFVDQVTQAIASNVQNVLSEMPAHMTRNLLAAYNGAPGSPATTGEAHGGVTLSIPGQINITA
jgi:hypothetical protein